MVLPRPSWRDGPADAAIGVNVALGYPHDQLGGLDLQARLAGAPQDRQLLIFSRQWSMVTNKPSVANGASTQAAAISFQSAMQ
jgi:hypothetical protein